MHTTTAGGSQVPSADPLFESSRIEPRPVSQSLASGAAAARAKTIVTRVPCPGLDELCQGANVYVQTVLRDDLVRLVVDEMGHAGRLGGVDDPASVGADSDAFGLDPL